MAQSAMVTVSHPVMVAAGMVAGVTGRPHSSECAVRSVPAQRAGPPNGRWSQPPGRPPPGLSPPVAGLAKMHNTRKARAMPAEARDMLGGNGILLATAAAPPGGDVKLSSRCSGPRDRRSPGPR